MCRLISDIKTYLHAPISIRVVENPRAIGAKYRTEPRNRRGTFRGFFQDPSAQQVGIDISLLENGAFYKSFPCRERGASSARSNSLSTPSLVIYLFWKINRHCPSDRRLFRCCLSMAFQSNEWIDSRL